MHLDHGGLRELARLLWIDAEHEIGLVAPDLLLYGQPASPGEVDEHRLSGAIGSEGPVSMCAY